MATFRNKGGKVRFTFANGRDPVVVAAGKSYKTDNEEVKTAFRKSGQFVQTSQPSSDEKKKEEK